MRVFITGGQGFIGKKLVKVFQSRVESVPLSLYFYKKGEDPNVIKDFQPDIIFHLAAELKDELEMFKSNAKLTGDLLMAAFKTGYKSFIYMGSSSEYGPKDKPMKESDECYPTSVYACTKIIGTIMAQLQAMFQDKNVIILRPFSVYGKGEPENKFISQAIKGCLHEKEIDLWEGSHDWVHVDDVIRALLYFSNLELKGEIVNIGTGIETTNEKVVELIGAVCKKPIYVKKHEGVKRKGDSFRWAANISKAKRLGWTPTISLEEGLKEMIDDFRKEKK